MSRLLRRHRRLRRFATRVDFLTVYVPTTRRLPVQDILDGRAPRGDA